MTPDGVIEYFQLIAIQKFLETKTAKLMKAFFTEKNGWKIIELTGTNQFVWLSVYKH